MELDQNQVTNNEKEKLSRGTKTLLLGTPGSGKTYSLTTFIEAGIPLFILGTDPGFEESILDAMQRKNLDVNMLHYAYVPPVTQGFNAIREVAQKTNAMSYADLGSLKMGINKHEYRQFFAVLDCLSDFKCEHCGKSFGAVDEFPKDVAFAFDGLTGLNTITMQNHVGGKPALHEGEWQVVMNTEETLIRTLCSNLQCFFVLTAHITKGYNPVTGIPVVTIDALGAKLGPRLPHMFSDVVVSIKEGDKFRWSTAELNYDLKNRALPISDKLEPSFEQIINVWRHRNELLKTNES